MLCLPTSSVFFFFAFMRLANCLLCLIVCRLLKVDKMFELLTVERVERVERREADISKKKASVRQTGSGQIHTRRDWDEGHKISNGASPIL